MVSSACRMMPPAVSVTQRIPAGNATVSCSLYPTTTCGDCARMVLYPRGIGSAVWFATRRIPAPLAIRRLNRGRMGHHGVKGTERGSQGAAWFVMSRIPATLATRRTVQDLTGRPYGMKGTDSWGSTLIVATPATSRTSATPATRRHPQDHTGPLGMIDTARNATLQRARVVWSAMKGATTLSCIRMTGRRGILVLVITTRPTAWSVIS